MAFWKQAIASLGIMGILASPAYAGDDRKTATPRAMSHQINSGSSSDLRLEDERVAVSGETFDGGWKLRPPTHPDEIDKFFPSDRFLMDMERDVPLESHPREWTILEYRVSTGADISFTLPKDFSLKYDGTVYGEGFHWNIFDDEFYYKDFAIKDFFDKLRSEEDPVMIGDMSLNDFLELYRNEKDTLNNAFDVNFDDLQQDFKNILMDKYSEDFGWALAWELLEILPKYGNDDGEISPEEYPELYEELKEFAEEFYDEDISEEDRRLMDEAIDDFARDMTESFNGLDISEALYLIAADHRNNIKIGDKTLGDVLDLADGIAGLLDIEKTSDGFRGHRVIEGKGSVHADIVFDYKVGSGDRVGNFSQALSIDQEMYGLAYADLSVIFTEGASLDSLLDDEIADRLMGIASLTGVDLTIPGIDLDGSMGFKTHSRMIRSESYELSEPTKYGLEGVGAVFLIEHTQQLTDDMIVKADLDVEKWQLTASLEEYWKESTDDRTSVLFYAFKEEDRSDFWYVISGGLETLMYDERVRWREQKYNLKLDLDGKLEVDESKSSGGWRDEGMKFRLSPSMAAGIKGKVVSQFIMYKDFPHKQLSFGAMIDVPHVTTRMSATMDLDEPRARLFRDPVRKDHTLKLETHITLLDPEGEKKVMEYYLETERGRVTPSMRDDADTRRARANLYSSLDGLMLSGNIENEEYLVRFIWGLDSTIFFGASYIGNTEEAIHGGDIVFGFDDFMVTGGYGTAVNGINTHQFKLSLAGTLRNKYLIFVDVHGMDSARPVDSYYESYYRDADITLRANISGPFDAGEILKCVFGWDCD